MLSIPTYERQKIFVPSELVQLLQINWLTCGKDEAKRKEDKTENTRRLLGWKVKLEFFIRLGSLKLVQNNQAVQAPA